MMKLRKIAALLAAVMMCVSCTARGAEVLTESAPEVQAAAEAGVLVGTDKGYELEREVTRAEALTFIERLSGAEFDNAAYTEPMFTDTEGHWACDTIEKFGHAGFIEGTGDGRYEPDRTVTAREFMKIFLSVKNGGAEGITLDNVYDRASEAGYLNSDAAKELVSENSVLTRSDAVRLCADALAAEDDETDNGETENTAADKFTGKLAALMPQDENYMVSPLSIKAAFAMVANGAEGETRGQLLSALEIEDLDAHNGELAADIERYGRDEVITVDINNSLWLLTDKSEREYIPSYAEAMNEYYSAELFERTSDKALDEMNGWVSEQTRGKINSIFSKQEYEKMLENDLFSVLINTVYFKAGWQNEFSGTDKDTFTDRNGKESEIDFMHDTGYYSYYDDGKMQIIELPYRRYEDGKESGLNISMYAVKGEYTYADAETAIANGLGNKRVSLSFPKFKTEYQTSVLELMNELGAVYVTDPENADLGAMYSGETGPGADKNPYISCAKHKTFIEVDEKGTEAAAVTAIGGAGATSVITEPPLEVKYDTPFMYIIRDNDTGETLFFGEYAFAE